jgi:hypothetical protein
MRGKRTAMGPSTAPIAQHPMATARCCTGKMSVGKEEVSGKGGRGKRGGRKSQRSFKRKRTQWRRTSIRGSSSGERRAANEPGDGTADENGADIRGENGRNLKDDEEGESDEVGRVATEGGNLLNRREKHRAETVSASRRKKGQ